MDQGRRFLIQQWGALIQTVGRREGLGWCRTGIQGGRVDGLVLMGLQLYTMISYASFGSNTFTN